MSPELASPRARSWTAALPKAWRGPLFRLALASLTIFAITFGDWLAMADQWWNISTYNHILFVPFIVAWLIWIRRAELAPLVPQVWWLGLGGLAAAMMLWLLGAAAGVNTVSQAGAVTALIWAAITTLGPRVAAACAFPLAYLLFLVPFGDELVPALQMITAVMVIWLTEASAIPAVIDGVFIDTPAGLFEVAEACSGVKFLVAMAALGVLVAYSCFTSWSRRIVFLAACLIVPIIANGVRAWGTIYIAQSAGLEFAEGFDHVFYGWVFFALVVAGLLAVFWRWFDRDPDDLGIDFSRWARDDHRAASASRPLWHLGAVAATLAVFPAWNLAAAQVEADIPARIAFAPVPGWTQVDHAPQVAWQPRMTGADHRLLGRFRDAQGRTVDVVFGLYAAQSEGREAGAFGQGALVPDTPWRRLALWPGDGSAHGEILFANGMVKRHALTSYRSGDRITGSVTRLKLATLADRLTLRATPTMTLILSVEGADDAEAAAAIAAFDTAMGDRGAWMDRIAGLR